MRIRIALTLGALVLAGGALTGGIALASQSAPPAPTATTKPTAPPTAEPTVTSKPLPSATTRPGATLAPQPATVYPGPKQRVPKAVPAGPVGDLHLPAIGETR